MKAVAILISGRGSNMQALVERADGYRVVLVASDTPDAAGLAWARGHGIATFALSPKGIGKAAYEAALDAALREAGADLVALAGYMRLLSDGFVAAWRGRVVNIHPSLLPLHKGLDTHARALAAGDRQGGCSVHLVTEELDGGRVLGQAAVPILPGDDADALAARVLVEEHRLYPAILSEFARTMTNPLDRIRQVATAMPEVEEAGADGAVTFAVAGRVFATVSGDTLRLSADDAVIDLAGDPDWLSVEDRVAHSWELAAPDGLLEAGGR